MSDKSGTTKKEKDWLGREKEVHYDPDGKKAGETKFTKDWLGRDKQEHYDTSGNKTGETRKGSDWLGRDRAEHYDKEDNKTGHSKNETDWLGRPIQRHYDKDGKNTGDTRRGTDWLGRPRKEHRGDYQKAHFNNSSSAASSSGAPSGYSHTSFPGIKTIGIGAIIIFIFFWSGFLGIVQSFVSSLQKGKSDSSLITVRSTVKADKISRGRTANEKVHEFILPPNQWVETSLLIKPNQEVMIHHFDSNEPIKINLGAMTDDRLQRAGTILPLYTSTNCANAPGVKAKVRYYCVQLNQPESVKLFAANTVRVGIVVKNR